MRLPTLGHCWVLKCRLGPVAPAWAASEVQATAQSEQTEEQWGPPVVKVVEFVPVAGQGLWIALYIFSFEFNSLYGLYVRSSLVFNGCPQGHFPYPDPSQWTDEELGILPDDED